MLNRLVKHLALVCGALFLLFLIAQPASAALSESPSAAPRPFKKINPTNGAVNLPLAVTLSWENSTRATGYEYCISTTPNCNSPATWVSVGAQTTANPAGLQNGTTYYWQVRARNVDGTRLADGGTWWSFSTRPICYLLTTSVTPTGTGSVDANPAPNCPWDATLYRAGTTVTLTADPSTGYVFAGWSGAITGTGNPKTVTVNAAKSVTATFAPLPGAFAKIGPAEASVVQATGATLSWGSSSNASSYQYCLDTTNNATCDSGWISVGSSTSVQVTGLSLETAYYWQVRARNAVGQVEADSDQWWSFKTQIAPPGAFGKVSPANGANNLLSDVTLSWQGSPRAAHYEYCFDTIDNQTCDTSWLDAGTSTVAFVTGLTLNTTYYWQVRACNTTACTDADSSAWWSLYPQLPVFQDSSPSVQYSGWAGIVDSHALSGTYRVSNTTQDKLTVTLKGTAVTLYTMTGPDQGKAQILVDGVVARTIDLYSPTVQWNVTQTVQALTNITHTVSVQVSGKKNVLSSGYSVSVDGIKVGKTYLDDANPAVKFGTWAGKVDARASGGSYRVTGIRNAIASMAFTGTSVEWITALGPNMGRAQVLIDGNVVDTVDQYSPTPQWQVVKTYSGLTLGPHVIQIRVLGTKRLASTGYKIVVDAFTGAITAAGTTRVSSPVDSAVDTGSEDE